MTKSFIYFSSSHSFNCFYLMIYAGDAGPGQRPSVSNASGQQTQNFNFHSFSFIFIHFHSFSVVQYLMHDKWKNVWKFTFRVCCPVLYLITWFNISKLSHWLIDWLCLNDGRLPSSNTPRSTWTEQSRRFPQNWNKLINWFYFDIFGTVTSL